MENAETILVIMLSTFLAIFLVLSIVLLAKCIQISNSVQRITDKAENVMDQAENIGEFFSRASGTFSVGRLLSNIADTVLHKHDNKKGK